MITCTGQRQARSPRERISVMVARAPVAQIVRPVGCGGRNMRLDACHSRLADGAGSLSAGSQQHRRAWVSRALLRGAAHLNSQTETFGHAAAAELEVCALVTDYEL